MARYSTELRHLNGYRLRDFAVDATSLDEAVNAGADQATADGWTVADLGAGSAFGSTADVLVVVGTAEQVDAFYAEADR